MGFLNSKRTPVNNKLHVGNIVEIKVEQEKMIKKLANKFGVGRPTIRNVLMERTWRQVRIKKAL